MAVFKFFLVIIQSECRKIRIRKIASKDTFRAVISMSHRNNQHDDSNHRNNPPDDSNHLNNQDDDSNHLNNQDDDSNHLNNQDDDSNHRNNQHEFHQIFRRKSTAKLSSLHLTQNRYVHLINDSICQETKAQVISLY